METFKQRIATCLQSNSSSNSSATHQYPLIEKENKWIQNVLEELISKRYFYKVHNEAAKVLTIVACHTDTEDKYLTLINNIQFLSFPNNDLVIVNSAEERYSSLTRQKVEPYCKAYVEIPNDNYMDFGKWNHVCRHFDVSTYDHVVFTNDSYFILGSIYPFYNKMLERNASLYGTVSSTEIRHHYQSYLFACRKDAVETFSQFFESTKHLIHGYQDLIQHLEIYFADKFSDKDCYLGIENMPTNQGKNIFFHNDLLYSKLRRARMLPLVKLRRLKM